MNKFKVIVWMTGMTALFHVLSWNFAERELHKVRIYARKNDHVKSTELLLIDDGPQYAGEQQVLVPARRFIKHYQQPGGHIMRLFLRNRKLQ